MRKVVAVAVAMLLLVGCSKGETVENYTRMNGATAKAYGAMYDFNGDLIDMNSGDMCNKLRVTKGDIDRMIVDSGINTRDSIIVKSEQFNKRTYLTTRDILIRDNKSVILADGIDFDTYANVYVLKSGDSKPSLTSAHNLEGQVYEVYELREDQSNILLGSVIREYKELDTK